MYYTSIDSHVDNTATCCIAILLAGNNIIFKIQRVFVNDDMTNNRAVTSGVRITLALQLLVND